MSWSGSNPRLQNLEIINTIFEPIIFENFHSGVKHRGFTKQKRLVYKMTLKSQIEGHHTAIQAEKKS